MSSRHTVDVTEISTWLRPPHSGGAWMDPYEFDVGTACYTSSYLWDCRIQLQVRIASDRIVESCCSIYDFDSKGSSEELASAVRAFLTGRTLATATDFSDTLFWSPSMVREAVYDALLQWAGTHPDRLAALPPTPYESRPAPSRLRRALDGLRGLVRL